MDNELNNTNTSFAVSPVLGYSESVVEQLKGFIGDGLPLDVDANAVLSKEAFAFNGNQSLTESVLCESVLPESENNIIAGLSENGGGRTFTREGLSERDNVIQSVYASISPKNTLAATTLKRLSNSEDIYDINLNKTTVLSNNIQQYTPVRLLSGNNKSSVTPKESIKSKNTQEIALPNMKISMFNPPQSNLEYSDIELALGKSYIDSSNNNNTSSNALDVLALYIKGQKLLYTEAKTYCEQQLNFLMLPAIFISCVGSIFSFLSNDYSFGPVIIASLNGFNAFLLALISYLKLDAKAQAHKTSAYKFDKLESVCEFNSGKFMFFAADPEDIFSVVERVEKDVKDIKEMNQFILPESIRYEFHFTYSTNVFMLVKRMQLMELSETHNLKNCVNHLTALRMQMESAKNQSNNDEIIQTLIDSINTEEIRKSEFLENVLNCRKKYYELDENFNREIRDHMKRVNQWFITRVVCCDWLKS